MRTAITVHCRADHGYPGRPLRIIWDERKYYVEYILREWREPATRCFLVATEEGIFELAYLSADDDWVLRQFSPLPGEL